MLKTDVRNEVVAGKKTKIIRVVLTQNVAFEALEGRVEIIRGTEILFDPAENIGFYDKNHFEVFDDEYSCLQ